MIDLEILRRDPPDPHPTPLLFVHGAWHGAWCWEDRFLDWFAERGWTAIAPSLRGHGGSPGASRWLRLRHYVDDVCEVAASLPAPPVWIGHSMGAYVVQHAIARRAAARAAVLLAPPPPHGVLRTTLDIARRLPLRFAKANLIWRLTPLVDTPALARAHFLRADAPDAVVAALSDRLGDESYLAFLDMLILDRPPIDATLPIPVHVLGGCADTIFSVDEVRATAARFGTDATIFPDAAHDLMLDAAWEDVARHIAELLPA